MADQSYANTISIMGINTSAGAYVGIDISGANAMVTPPIGSSFKVLELRMFCQTALTATQALVTVTKRPIPGVETSAVTVATFTPLATYIAGDVILIDISSSANAELNPGEQLKFLPTGGGTGTVWFGMTGYFYSSAPSPQNTGMPSTAKAPTAGVGTYKRLAATIS